MQLSLIHIFFRLGTLVHPLLHRLAFLVADPTHHVVADLDTAQFKKLSLIHISLSSWFGGVLFIAAGVPIIFRTVRQSDPLLPTVLSVNLEGQHATLLANTIVGNLLSMLFKLGIGCAVALVITVIGQWCTLDMHQEDVKTFCAVRSILLRCV